MTNLLFFIARFALFAAFLLWVIYQRAIFPAMFIAVAISVSLVALWSKQRGSFILKESNLLMIGTAALDTLMAFLIVPQTFAAPAWVAACVLSWLFMLYSTRSEKVSEKGSK